MFTHPALHAFTVDIPDHRSTISAVELAGLAARLAATSDLWRPLVRHDPAARWYERLLLTDDLEVWLIGWAPGQGTPAHDHGEAAGAMAVAEGSLLEEVYERTLPAPARTAVHRLGATLAFPPDHVHRVRNVAAVNATSVHAYSPPDRPMRVYRLPAPACQNAASSRTAAASREGLGSTASSSGAL